MTKSQRWRFSLRELLLITAVVALSIGMYVTAKKNAELSQAVADLKTDAALLVIEDESLVNLVAIPDASPFEQNWRIQIPEKSGYDYYLSLIHI